MRTGVLLLALLSVSSLAHAQVPRLISYQGTLSSGGNPVPDGSYAITFRLYDAATGGAALYTEAQPAVPVLGGGLSVILGAGTPLTLAFDAPYWVGMQVGSDPEMSPRVALTAAPYALSLALPFTGNPHSSVEALALRNDDPHGEALRVTGALNVTDGAGPRAVLRSFPGEGSQLRVDNDDGSVFAAVGTADASSGSYATVYEPDMGLGAIVSCPPSGTTDPVLWMVGASGTITLGTQAADVTFPQSMFRAQDHAGHTGIANIDVAPIPPVTTDITVLRSVTVDCPTAGYVLVMASTQVHVSHVAGVLSSKIVGVSDDESLAPQNQDLAVRLEAAFPTGDYFFPIKPHRLFPVTAGSHTFYLLGQDGAGGTFTVGTIAMTCIFVPTGYGAVATVTNGPGDETSAAPQGSAGLPAPTIEEARLATARLTEARRKRERDAYEASVATLRRDTPKPTAAGSLQLVPEDGGGDVTPH